jgi:hypothetical protein
MIQSRSDLSSFLRAQLRLGREVKGKGPHQQLKKHHSQGVDVGPGIHIQLRHLGLLGTHVLRRSDHLPHPGHECPIGELTAQGLGDAEVDDLHHRLVFLYRYQDVGRLQVPVDDALLMGVLNGVTHVSEEA